MESIENHLFNIYFQEESYTKLNEYLQTKQPSSIFIMVDENTMHHCYPVFMPELKTESRIEVIAIDPGEEHKSIETCSGVWSAMVELGIDRNSLVINLGGGVITDLGGFVASTIKRGVDFIHVPTSLLGMVDAAIGGKNGVDLGPLKNQIGVIVPPIMTLIDTRFLRTLDEQQLVNGSIEMFKHGLIADKAYWNDMINAGKNYYNDIFDNLIFQSALIKNDVVVNDPTEKGARKALNYGHTAGHAIESFCLTQPDQPDVLHGEAVAAGILVESFLSTRYTDLSPLEYDSIKNWYKGFGFTFSFTDRDIQDMIQLMAHDKKNVNGEIRFVLLSSIGDFVTDQKVENEDIVLAFHELATV